MPVYELVAIARTSLDYAPLRNLLTETGAFVMSKGGAVRDYNYWGKRTLPQRPSRKGLGHHTEGEYWTMNFDCNPPTLYELRSKMRIDPRIIRWTVLKHGSNLKAATELFDRADGPHQTYDRSSLNKFTPLKPSDPNNPLSDLYLEISSQILDPEQDTVPEVKSGDSGNGMQAMIHNARP